MSPTHWLIVIAVLLLLFGAKKLPEMARSVGQSARVLKGEMKGLKDDEAASQASTTSEQPKAVEPAPVPASTTGSTPVPASTTGSAPVTEPVPAATAR